MSLKPAHQVGLSMDLAYCRGQKRKFHKCPRALIDHLLGDRRGAIERWHQDARRCTLPTTISSKEGSGLISGVRNRQDSSVVSTSAASSLVISARSGSGSHTSSPAMRPRSSNGQTIWITLVYRYIAFSSALKLFVARTRLRNGSERKPGRCDITLFA